MSSLEPVGKPQQVEQAGEGGTLAPIIERPQMPKPYGVPEGEEGTLPWSWAEELLAASKNYWVASTRPDGRPHVVPIWGVWIDGAFYFEGGRETRRGRNIAQNPAVSIHVERGEDIVIIEGVAEEISSPEPALATRIADTFEQKYSYRPDPAMWDAGELYRVRPKVVLGWGNFPTTCTRWRFSPRE